MIVFTMKVVHDLKTNRLFVFLSILPQKKLRKIRLSFSCWVSYSGRNKSGRWVVIYPFYCELCPPILKVKYLLIVDDTSLQARRLAIVVK